MIALLGESASGKTTLEKMLNERLKLNRIISYSTRSIRDNEINNVDYHFISDEEFENKLTNDDFAEHQCFNGWKYGIDKSDCTNDKICIVTPSGLKQLKEKENLNIISIYIKSDKLIRIDRGYDRNDNRIEMLRRIKADEIDFENVEDNVSYVIENNSTLEDAYDKIVEILRDNEVIS